MASSPSSPFLPRPNTLVLPLLFFLLLLTLFPNPSSAAPRATEAGIVCSSNHTAPKSQRQTFIANFIAALNTLTPQIASHGYGKSHNTSGGSRNFTSVYAFSECIKDLSPTDCNLCFSQIKTQLIQKCLPYQRLVRSGRLFFDGCFIRYEYSSNFYRESVSSDDKTRCGSDEFGGSNKTIFRENVVRLVRNLSVGAVTNSSGIGFFSAGSLTRKNVTVYGLAQCWKYLNRTGCKSCLDNAVSSIAAACPPKVEGRGLNAGCYLRYSTHKFYNTSVDPPLPTVASNNRGSPLAVILATVLSSLALLMFLVGAVFIGRNYMQKRRESKEVGNLLSTMNKSKLHFSYEILEEATNYFDDSKKLGQGGSGSVYKGRLADGSEVAIKRLFFNTRQWVDHFFNEINLISSIEHKNLVKLLGCSITGPESLLVYEYIPNQSLHHHIFGKEKGREIVSWEDRYKIIFGIAEGLAYLHEKSGFRIIHRDIKLNNVLLDHDFTPKIADFGLVRLIPEDKSHLTTAIAGTLGYMAPEYIVCGILTEKADVYSFGVVLIEIVSGKRNNSLTEDSVCMLHSIWNLYVRRRLEEGVDKGLEGKFKEDEACRLLHIGLLCVQANAEVRPTMSGIVKMIIDQEEQLPEPTQPPFLNSSSAEISRQIQSEEEEEGSGSSRSVSPRNSCNTGREGTISDNSWVDPR